MQLLGPFLYEIVRGGLLTVFTVVHLFPPPLLLLSEEKWQKERKTVKKEEEVLGVSEEKE